MSETVVKTSDLMKVPRVNIQSRIDMILDLDKRLIEIIDKLNEKGYEAKDSRILMLRYLNELHLSTIFIMSFQAECISLFCDKQWFKSKVPHLEKKIDSIRDFEKVSFERFRYIASNIKDFFLISYFSEFESRMRNIVRVLGNVPNVDKTGSIAFLNGNEPFELIYRGFYEKYLIFNKKDYEVLKMFSSIRNTIHNGGFYFSIKKKDLLINYRGKTYHFVYGKPVNFLDDIFIKQLILDLLTVIEKTFLNNKISSIKIIDDNISKVNFKIEV